MPSAPAPSAPGLAASLAAALALGATPSSLATNLNVLSCTGDSNDIATLRKVVASAGIDDTIDLSALACSMITLTLGEIPIGVRLTLLGPADHALAINAFRSCNSRVFHVIQERVIVSHRSVTS